LKAIGQRAYRANILFEAQIGSEAYTILIACRDGQREDDHRSNGHAAYDTESSITGAKTVLAWRSRTICEHQTRQSECNSFANEHDVPCMSGLVTRTGTQQRQLQTSTFIPSNAAPCSYRIHVLPLMS
jgi:hypothetical protein